MVLIGPHSVGQINCQNYVNGSFIVLCFFNTLNSLLQNDVKKKKKKAFA